MKAEEEIYRLDGIIDRFCSVSIREHQNSFGEPFFVLSFVKAGFHSAFFVARTTFLLFKLNSFTLHSTRKFRRQKKKVARATKKVDFHLA